MLTNVEKIVDCIQHGYGGFDVVLETHHQELLRREDTDPVLHIDRVKSLVQRQLTRKEHTHVRMNETETTAYKDRTEERRVHLFILTR